MLYEVYLSGYSNLRRKQNQVTVSLVKINTCLPANDGLKNLFEVILWLHKFQNKQKQRIERRF